MATPIRATTPSLSRLAVPKRPGPASGIGFLVVAALCWGTTGTLGTLLARTAGLPFLSVAAYRILLGGLLMLAFGSLAGGVRWPSTPAAWGRVLAIGACSAVNQIAFFTAVGLVGVSIATLVTIGSCPAMVAVVDVLTGRHRLDRRLGAALVLAATGLGLLAGVPPSGLSAGTLLLGCLTALVAGAGFAGITLLVARPVAGYEEPTGTGLALASGGVLVLAVAAGRGSVTFTPEPAALALVLGLGLISGAVAFLAYTRGLQTESSTTGAMVSLLEPITSMALAALVLGERLSAGGLAGAAVLLGAVALAAIGAAGPPAAPQPTAR